MKISSLSPEKRALLEKLAAARASKAGAAIAPRVDRSTYPLSFAQERLYFLDRLAGGDPFYVLPSALELRGRLDVDALRRAFAVIVERHEVLRATFHEVDGAPVQTVAAPSDFALPVIPAGLDEAHRIAAEDARTPFDLAKGPLLRAKLVAIGPEHHVLVASMHHIVSDGWSTSVLLAELGLAYSAHASGSSPLLPPLAIQYADYAAWQRTSLGPETVERHVAFFREALAGAPALLALPTDRPRPAEQAFVGADLHFAWSPRLAEAVRELARAHGATPFMVLLAAFQTLLGRLAGESDVVVGASVAGRDRLEVENLVGFFVNIVMLRASLTGDPSFAALLERTKKQTLDAFAHRDLPFDRLVDAIHPSRTLAHAPVFQVNFILQNAPEGTLALPGLDVRALPVAAGSARFDLVLSMEENERGLSGTFTYRTDLWESASVARIAQQLRTLLESVTANADQRVSLVACDALVPAIATAVVPDRPVHALIEDVARRSPSTPALAYRAETITYGELDAASNRLAAHLRANGVRRGVRVAIAAQRSPARVIAILAAWKAGGAYVPLDLANPLPRITAMLEDAAVDVAIADEAGIDLLPASLARVVDLEDPNISRCPSTPMPWDGALDDEAYVLFTSGSTGRPKGVSVRHRGLTNLALAQRRAFGLGPADRVLQFAPFGFDASVSELVIALTEGAVLDLGDGAAWNEVEPLEALLARRAITCVTLPPSLLREMRAEALPALRIVVTAGEACDPKTAQRWRAGGRAVFNAYGPTETTVCATIHAVEAADGEVVPVGRAMTGMSVHVLDLATGRAQVRALAPIGGYGEIAIGGIGVAAGYVGERGADLTAERFVDGPDGRLFLTGDRGRDRGDGVILFAGRIDEQIKVRGHRVEPGEVEVALRGHPDVEDVAVVLRELGEREALVAFVVCDGSPDLCAFLADKLPPYMIPARIVEVPSLPRSVAGKVDRAALVVPSATASDDEREPSTDAERVLAPIWANILGRERVGPRDNFFTLGGDSIASLKVVARAAAAGLAITPKLLFEHQTLERLAAHATPQTAALASATASDDDARYPLSPVQEGMLFHALYDPASAVYVSQFCCTIHGALDIARFTAAWRTVVARHSALRTVFIWDGLPRPLQTVLTEVELPLTLLDGPQPDHAAAERRRGFDLSRGPLFRLSLVRHAPDRHELVWTHHHAILDGWSVATVLGEVVHLATSDAPLPPAKPYRAYIDHLRSVDRSRAGAYWRAALGGVAHATALPIGEPSRGAVTRTREIAVRIGKDETTRIVRVLREAALTPSTLVTAAWAELVGRLGGHSEVVLGVTVAGRPAELVSEEPIVGLFINTLPIKVDRASGTTTRSYLGGVQHALVAMREHEHTPLADVHRCTSIPRGEPLFESIVVYENFPHGGATDSSLHIGDVGGAEQTSYPLTVVAAPGEELELRIAFDEDRFESAAVSSLLSQLRTLIVSLTADLERPACEAPHLDRAARAALLALGEGPKDEAFATATVPTMFAALAREAPAQIALEQQPHTMSYGELLERATGFAGTLAAAGVGPGSIVALAVERSVALHVALLGTWFAGATAVPLDPSHPPARLALTIEDANADVIVATVSGAMRTFAMKGRARLVVLDPAAMRHAPLQRAPAPDDTAYVLYTSGSTGRPKGVAVSHAALANYMLWARDAYAMQPDGATALHSSFAFDLTLTSVLLPLVSGGRAVIVAEGQGTEALAELVRSGAPLALLKLTPSHLAYLLATLGDSWRGHLASAVVVGGEAFASDLVRATQRADPSARIFNEYGPTEACIGCVVHEVGGAETGAETSVPVGRPIRNTRALVLDEAREPCAFGVVGELYLGGTCLAKGYLGREKETAERFVETPYGRMYRTGDRARLRGDGLLEYLGRDDDQVKIRGHRVELAEVAHAIRKQPEIADAAVLHEKGRLVAYVVARQESSADQVLERVRADLPPAFVPHEIVFVDALPLAASGKIDRVALARLRREVSRGASEALHVPPATERERVLASIWESVLDRRPVGREDDFFALGGDSILALQVIARAAGEGLAISPKLIFEHRRLVAIASHAAARGPLPETFLVAEGEAPLTPIQAWFFERATKEPSHYNQSVLFAIRGDLDTNALREAFFATLDHHGITRTRFVEGPGGMRQRHGGERWTPGWRHVDLTAGGADAGAGEVAAAIERHANEAQRGLDLASGRLASGLVVSLGAERGHRVLLVLHHLVVDAVSWRPLLDDLQGAYAQRLRGANVALAPVSTSFLAWSRLLARHAESAELREELGHWTRTVAGAPARLPRADGGSGLRTNRAVSVLRTTFDAAALHDAAPRWSCRVHELLLAALAASLAPMMPEGVLVDLEGHGREPPGEVAMDLSRTVGWFTALYPVRLPCPDGAPAAHAAAVRDALRAVPAGGIGYGVLRYLLTEPALVEAGRADVSFNYLGRVDGSSAGGANVAFEAAAESRGEEEGAGESRAYALEINGFTRAGETTLEWAFNADELDAAAVEATLARFRDAVARYLAEQPATAELSPAKSGRASANDPLLVRFDRFEGRSAGEELFLVHPVGGSAACYADLARELRELGAWQVYGIQAVGLDGLAPPLRTIEAMAARYVEAIRSVRPHGPWWVGGWSLGALVALEVVRLLGLSGQADLVAIDQTPSEVATDLDDRSILEQIAGDVLGLGGAFALRGQTTEERIRALLDEARRRGLPLEEAALRRHVEITTAGFHALATFRPKPIDGRVVIVRAETRGHKSGDAQAEWAALARGGAELAVVPGDHLTLLRPPNVEVVARTLVRAARQRLRGV